MQDELFEEFKANLNKAPDIKSKVAVYKEYLGKIVELEKNSPFDNYPWGKNNHDGFPHQGAAYKIISAILQWSYWEEYESKPICKDQIWALDEIAEITGNLELPPQMDREKKDENDPRIAGREADWLKVVELVEKL